MAIKDIVVHVDFTPACEQRLEIAVRLAKRHDAHLSAVFARSARPNGEVKAAEERFARQTGQAGVRAEWRTVAWSGSDGHAVDELLLHARHGDLVIAGQTRPGAADGALPSDTLDRLLLESGRPLLAVPHAGKFPEMGSRALVAWNGGRTAARAVHDAIPLLRDAQQVIVLVLNPKDAGRGHGDIPGADLCRHLARHGVRAEAQSVEARDMDVGNRLLSWIADEGVDLLVMGGYGTSRIREQVLGGATRDILAQMTVPVLLSH